MSAIQDAVVLANCIYELHDNPSVEEINKSFQYYRSERYPHAKAAYDTSHRLAGLVGQVMEEIFLSDAMGPCSCHNLLRPTHTKSHLVFIELVQRHAPRSASIHAQGCLYTFTSGHVHLPPSGIVSGSSSGFGTDQTSTSTKSEQSIGTKGGRIQTPAAKT